MAKTTSCLSASDAEVMSIFAKQGARLNLHVENANISSDSQVSNTTF